MPTGYTYKLVEKGQTFEEFTMTCARGFGALAFMRDSPFDTEIPEVIPTPAYHLEQLDLAGLELLKLNIMPDDAIPQFCDKKRQERQEDYLRRSKAVSDGNVRILEMIEKVKRWVPPTEDHIELKQFMLDQLQKSIYTFVIEKPPHEDDATIFSAACAKLKNDMQYHTEEYRKDSLRCINANRWLTALRKSLKPAEGL